VRPRPLASVLVLLLALSGCGADSADGDGSGVETGDLTVLAAASLTEAFAALAEDFEQDHPGVEVRLSFDSSATLAEQVNQGAPADVLATADEDTMQSVVGEGGTDDDPQVFATNHLVLAVPADNPADISKLDDLDDPDVDYVVCVDTAPCGKLAKKVLVSGGVGQQPASEEVDVKAVLSKVELDEADAGLVYASDVATAGGKVEEVDLPTSEDNLSTYPIAALSAAEEPRLAGEWVDLVLSPAGRQALSDAGFGTP